MNLQCQSGQDPSSGFQDIHEKQPHWIALKIYIFFDMTLTFDPINEKTPRASGRTLYTPFITDNLWLSGNHYRGYPMEKAFSPHLVKCKSITGVVHLL